jgi:hypothetical protein
MGLNIKVYQSVLLRKGGMQSVMCMILSIWHGGTRVAYIFSFNTTLREPNLGEIHKTNTNSSNLFNILFA